MAQLP
jgi:cullin 3